jgi:hypothetical protein
VPIGATFVVDVECDPMWQRDDGGIVFFATRVPNPPTYRRAFEVDPTGFNTGIDADGTFRAVFRAPMRPQVVYLRASCLFDAWESDALQPNDTGGTTYYFYYYPPDRMVPIEFVAVADDRLPPTR